MPDMKAVGVESVTIRESCIREDKENHVLSLNPLWIKEWGYFSKLFLSAKFNLAFSSVSAKCYDDQFLRQR